MAEEAGASAKLSQLLRGLRPLSEESAPALSAPTAAAALWLLHSLLLHPENASILHVRGDAALLIRIANNLRAGRDVRLAAMSAFQALQVAEGSQADMMHAIGELLQAAKLLPMQLEAAAAAPPPAPSPADGLWQATLTLSALCHTCAGRCMPHPRGGDELPRAPHSSRRATQEAFLKGNGPEIIAAIVRALGGFFEAPPPSGSAPATVRIRIRDDPHASSGPAVCQLAVAVAAPLPPERGSAAEKRQASALWLLRACLRTLGASVQAEPALAERCWLALGEADGVQRLLLGTGVLGSVSRFAASALAAVLELATGEGAALVMAANVVLQHLQALPHPQPALRLLETLHGFAASSEAACVELSRGGGLSAALRLLTAPDDARGGHPALRPALLRLSLHLARAWSGPEELRMLIGNALGGGAGPISRPWLSALVELARPLGPALPYAWLRPPHGRLKVDLQDRAWPPAQAYTVACWLRRPDAAAVAAGPTAPFALYEFASADQRSYTAAHLCEGVLTLKAGSSLKLGTREVKLSLSSCEWHHIAVVHERRKPLHESQLSVFLDGKLLQRCSLLYPALLADSQVACTLGHPAAALGEAAGAAGGVGWHLGPSFACELNLDEAQLRDACAWGFSSPWLQPRLAEVQDDELLPESRLCSLQRARSAPAEELLGAEGEMRLHSSKVLFTVAAPDAGGVDVDWGGLALVRPRRLAQALPAVGGCAALLSLIKSASDAEDLMLALRALRFFLTDQPLNLHAFDPEGYYGLRFVLRSKPKELLTDEVCDLLLDMCTNDRVSSAADTGALLGAFGAEAEGAPPAAPSSAERSPAILVNLSAFRIVLLDGELWGSAAPKVQRHWLQRLHGLLSEDSAGGWNANRLVAAGCLDVAQTLLSTGALLSSGAHLLAARLVLRVWHAGAFSTEITQRLYDFLAWTLEPDRADVQLLCLRMLGRMTAHASASLEHAKPAEAAELPHAGARSVLALLRPKLLLAYLQPEHACVPRAVALAVRLIATLLLLGHRYPSALAFERTFLETQAVEEFGLLLPLHAKLPDVWLSLLQLALGRAPGVLEAQPVAEAPEQLVDSAKALLDSLRDGEDHGALAAFAPTSLSLVSLMVRESLRMGATGGSRQPADDPGSAAILQLFAGSLPVVRNILQRRAVIDALLQPHAEALQRVCSAFGTVWRFACASTAEAAVPLAAVAGDTLDALADLLASAVIDAPQALAGAAGQAALDLMLDPLPSMQHSGVSLETWMLCRGDLLRRLLQRLQSAAAARSQALSEPHLKLVASLYRRAVRTQAATIFPDKPDAPRADALPHPELLTFALLLIDRDDGQADSNLLRAVGASSAAAVSNLVSWTKSAVRSARNTSGGERSPIRLPSAVSKTSDITLLALRLLCARFPGDRAPAAALLPLLGDVAMFLVTLASDGGGVGERGGLQQHRGAVGALAWRLFELFRHADKDVQRGAISQWVTLVNQAPWLQKEAFGDSPLIFDWEPLHQGALTPSSFASWVAEHHGPSVNQLESTLGSCCRDELERLRVDADAWVTLFTKDQAAKAAAELSWQRAAQAQLPELCLATQALRSGAISALERRSKAVRSAELARDCEHGRRTALMMQRHEVAWQCSELTDIELPGVGGSVMRDPATMWRLDTSCVSAQGMRRKLERVPRARTPATRGAEAAGSAAAPEADGAADSSPMRLSELFDCPQLRTAAGIVAVSHVRGLDAAKALLAIMPGCVALLYGYELAEPDLAGHATARARRDAHVAGAYDFEVLDGLQSRAARYRRISIAHVSEVVRRRYQLQPWALQLLLRDGETVLLSVDKGEAARDKLFGRLSALVVPRSLTSAADGRASAAASGDSRSWPAFSFDMQTQLTEAWQRGSTSNFEYLMQLNHLSGRCYDDLMQYPVFPWVLREHDKAVLNLRTPSSFREFGKPMGGQTETRAAHFQKRFAEWGETEGAPPFHYGTHYSSAAAVSSYLIRLEPFSSYHCALQDGRFDLADRLFHSIGEEWKLSSGEKGCDTGCVKELVPEFFYLWEALLNPNALALGRRQDGSALGRVALPGWARGSAWKFVRMMRQALESPHASRELPVWLDLIFGCLQQGDAAAAALNAFLPCTYVGAVDLGALEEHERAAVLSQIQLVGQTPEQLWRDRKHPGRNSAAALNTVPLVPLLVALAAGQRLVSGIETAGPAPARSPPVRGLLVGAGGERAVALAHDCCPLPRSQLVVRWGFADGSLRFYPQRAAATPTAAPALLAARLHGGEVIKAACVSSDGTWLATADFTGAIAVWRVRVRAAQAQLRGHGRLCGHRSPVRDMACSSAHRLLASTSTDGVLLLWDLRKCLLVHAMRVCPSPVPGLAPTPESLLAGLCVVEDTAEVLVATQTQLQLWSVNGALLAVSREAFPVARSLALLRAPEWMVEQLPIVATGHSDGSVRWWSVREPREAVAIGSIPCALSRLPVRSPSLPAWELYELAHLRLEGAEGTGAAVTGICVGDGYEKLLWTGDDAGRVASWHVPSAEPDAAQDVTERLGAVKIA